MKENGWKDRQIKIMGDKKMDYETGKQLEHHHTALLDHEERIDKIEEKLGLKQTTKKEHTK